MQIQILVTFEVERLSGPFESRDALGEAIVEGLEGALPDALEGDNGGQYEVTDSSMEVQPAPARGRRA